MTAQYSPIKLNSPDKQASACSSRQVLTPYHTDYHPINISALINRLQIWESHASPPLYFFAIKYYKKPGAMPRYHRPSDDPGSLEREMKHFRDSFKIKTGVAWNLRMKKADAKGFVNVPKGEKHGFRYQIPVGSPRKALPGNSHANNQQTRGKPVGLVNGRKYSVVGKDGDKKTAASLGKAPKMHTRPASESANRSVEDRIMTDVSNFAYEDSEPKSDAPKCRPASFATMDEGRIPNHPAVPREGQAIGHPQKKPSLALKSVLPGSRTPQKAIGHRMVPSAPSKRDTGVGSKRSRDMFQGAPTGTAQKELAVRMDPINESKLRAAKNSPVATRGRSRVKITVKGRGTSRDEATGHRAAASGPSSRPPTAQDRDGSDSDAAMQDAFDEGTEGPGFFSSQQGKNYAVRARAKKAIVGEPAVGSLPGVNAQDEDDADDESPGHEPHVDKSGGAEDLREQEHLAAMAEHARAAAAAGEDSDSGHSTDSDGL